MSRRSDADGGFTLVELLVTVVVLTLIMGAITGVVIASIRTSAGVSGRLSDSSSSSITSAYYVRDVESAAFVTTESGASSPTPCGQGTSAATGLTFYLAMSWGSPTAGGQVASYWSNSSTGDIVRLFCTGGSNTPASEVSIPAGLSSTSGMGVVITPAASASAASSGWTSTINVSGVALATLQSASGYHFELLGVPRVTAPAGHGGNPAPPPLLLLGSGRTVLGCSGSNGTINVNGTAYIDSTSDGAGDLGNSTLTATQIYSADTNPAGSITTGPNGSFSPNPPTNGPVVSDPYSSLTPPTTLTPGSSATVSGVVHYHPGYYTSLVNLTGSTDYVFDTGTYIFQGGLSIAGNGTVSSGIGGVLFYFSGGTLSVTGGGALTLSPETPAPYVAAPDLVIWQAKADTSIMSLVGNGGVTTITGIIYAPGATVSGGGNGNYEVGGIISNAFACNGNGSATIG